jgi:hypothetical protein
LNALSKQLRALQAAEPRTNVASCARSGAFTQAAELAEAYETQAESTNAELKKRVAELESDVNRLRAFETLASIHRATIADLESQLAWTPVSDGLPTEPGWYVFHGAEREPELLYGADTGRYSFWVGGSKTYDMEEMSHFSYYRRIELPKEGET